MRTFFVVNPAAGRGRGKSVWERIRPQLHTGGAWEAALTTDPGHATALARRAAENGFDRVAALGGDGTINEVVNGLIGTDAALGLVPGGTGNDYARMMGVPADPLQAAEFALSGPTRMVDVGEVETDGGRRHYPNVAGIGFDAAVARNVNAYPKYLGGTVPYVLGVVKTLWRYRPQNLRFWLDEEPLERKVLLAAVGISRWYGGGMMITPDALLDDGLFDVCIAGNFGRLEALRLLPTTYTGSHVRHPKIEMRRCRELRVTAETQVAVHADGEVLGDLPATFRVRPGALKVIARELPKQ